MPCKVRQICTCYFLLYLLLPLLLVFHFSFLFLLLLSLSIDYFFFWFSVVRVTENVVLRSIMPDCWSKIESCNKGTWMMKSMSLIDTAVTKRGWYEKEAAEINVSGFIFIATPNLIVLLLILVQVLYHIALVVLIYRLLCCLYFHTVLELEPFLRLHLASPSWWSTLHPGCCVQKYSHQHYKYYLITTIAKSIVGMFFTIALVNITIIVCIPFTNRWFMSLKLKYCWLFCETQRCPLSCYFLCHYQNQHMNKIFIGM